MAAVAAVVATDDALDGAIDDARVRSITSRGARSVTACVVRRFDLFSLSHTLGGARSLVLSYARAVMARSSDGSGGGGASVG